jgi:hypothetical protein
LLFSINFLISLVPASKPASSKALAISSRPFVNMRFLTIVSTLAVIAAAAPQSDGPGVPGLEGKFDLWCGDVCHPDEGGDFRLNDANRFLFDPSLPNGNCINLYGDYEKCWFNREATCDGSKCGKAVFYTDENCWEESRPSAQIVVGRPLNDTCAGPGWAKFKAVRIFPTIDG